MRRFSEFDCRTGWSLAFLLVLTISLTACGGSSNSSNGGAAPTATISASPSTITAGQSTSLIFSSTNATGGTINNGIGQVGTNGKVSVSPNSPTTYTYTATNTSSSVSASVTVQVNQPPPLSVTLTASPSAILQGAPVTLTWSSNSNVTSVVLSSNLGWSQGVQPSGSYTLQPPPSQNTTYTATAYGPNGQQSVTSQAQVTVNPMTSFDGLYADQVTGGTTEEDIDPNGAVGTKQFMEYVNTSYQGYDKTTFAPVWSSPQPIGTPWDVINAPHCIDPKIQLDAVITFDRLANVWVIAAKTTTQDGFYFCIAVSNTDDLTSKTFAWYAYYFDLQSLLGSNSDGTYLPDWPKIGTWWNGYYAAMDLVDTHAQTENGILICAFNRTSMLTGIGAPNDPSLMACAPNVNVPSGGYLGHSLIPADVDGTTAPPNGRDEYLVSIENPSGSNLNSNLLNLWDCQLSWTTPSLSCTNTQPTVQPYIPGCYNYDPSEPSQTDCVPEPGIKAIGGLLVDSVGDRLMPRFSYRNFGSYESFLVSDTVQTGPGANCTSNNCQLAYQTGIQWYEFLGNGSNTPVLNQEGTINPDNTNFRFLPSIAQDKSGNVVAGYSTSSPLTNPGISVSYWNLNDPIGPASPPTEVSILTSAGEEVPFIPGTYQIVDNGQWGSYAAISVDPEDDCTFWYVNEYWPITNTAGLPAQWKTNVSTFKIPNCQ